MQLNLFAEYSQIFDYLEKIIPKNFPLFLVGGAIRDALLQQPTHDLDFVLGGNVRSTARKIADQFKGSFFLLDDERNTARVLLPGSNNERMIIDFAAIQGEDIHEDLIKRDFTINAIAFDLRKRSAVDPLKGALDLKNRRLVPCSAEACMQDPVRVLRGVRLALKYDLKITPSARTAMCDAVTFLHRVSAERIRDEIFRILDLQRTTTALRMLDAFGVTAALFPELVALKERESSGESRINPWERSLATLSHLETLFSLIIGHREEEQGENLMAGMLVLRLGPYRYRMQEHMESRLNPNRTKIGLLKLAGLYVGIDPYLNTTNTLDLRAHEMALSNIEIQHLCSVVQAEKSLSCKLKLENGINPRTMHRYFRQFGTAGLDGCLLFLARYWAERGIYLDPKDWGKQIEAIYAVFEAWWDKHDEIVEPPTLLNGKDLMNCLDLDSGPLVGALLREIRERQADGEITNRDEALEYARKRLSRRE
jgi:poly(A) polymerase